ncbi:Bifunctional purine biosynthetic protein ade1 [Lobosporangium transversale]|uniref:Phosphoribosylaminoimidazole-succinocarboxamide synthase n=1 Tax=Lobosporangium transversale TaxID=64571 RepID=A0A1Y2GIN0_9FUNG|nr:phosphoribosylaminoimidazole-succinocarboxamide synthase [Lobosporangium transversale]KAF9918338.1 Bifunctional purine biosynthetic protein ade1 [Lobosporangium transversale]ORZ12032.1 phosphoribosylaminoimidazole-succinocarboxamide synthase [Lobosporangium transversale]|eukprot:XP_021879897.1 phosphoribosylaminoimidazole-succinocarboxamide synthase [Lobosporangium transversale]
MTAVVSTNCPDLQFVARGKVRDLYRVDDHSLLFVATDRISAFDVIMNNGITNKGKLLTKISDFWFSYLKDVVPNHLITANFEEMPDKVKQYRDQLEGRSMLVKSLRVLPIESIVRGYITGSAWKEYKEKGTVCDIALPEDMQESQAFPKPLWTPSTKAEIGDHDENIHPSKAAAIIGEKHAAEMARVSVELYTKARDYALEHGIIIADTKFEFGVDENDNLYLIDEVLTPDSSRFWPAASYKVGASQDSFDKQYIRNYLESIGFDKTTGITLPEHVVTNTMAKYQEAYRLLTSKDVQL